MKKVKLFAIAVTISFAIIGCSSHRISINDSTEFRVSSVTRNYNGMTVYKFTQVNGNQSIIVKSINSSLYKEGNVVKLINTNKKVYMHPWLRRKIRR